MEIGVVESSCVINFLDFFALGVDVDMRVSIIMFLNGHAPGAKSEGLEELDELLFLDIALRISYKEFITSDSEPGHEYRYHYIILLAVFVTT